MSKIYRQHRCAGTSTEGICSHCGLTLAFNGLATVEELQPLTDAEQRELVRDKVTMPMIKQLYEQGLIGGSSTVTYPNLSK